MRADVVLFKDKIASSETRTNMQYVIVTDDISRIVKLKYVLGYDLSDIKEIALDYIDYLGQKQSSNWKNSHIMKWHAHFLMLICLILIMHCWNM